ncbi:hypothetical protein BDR22DRAFT_821779 [Usnea florida]
MAISKTRAAHLCTSITCHQAKTDNCRRSQTQARLSDPNYLRVPASVWNHIHYHNQIDKDYMEAAKDTLTRALAADTTSPPMIGLIKVHKCFWDRSLETKTRNDTYRYRVLDTAASEATIGDELDPEDDTRKIKILYVSLSFKDHIILLLRRLCPDVNMDAIGTGDGWRQYLGPSIRQGFAQVRQSTTCGWAPVTSRKKRRTITTRSRRRRAPTASSRSKKSSDQGLR